MTNAPGMPLPQHGAAGGVGCVTLADGRRFLALSYSGDLAGWEDTIAFGAKAAGVDLARVSPDGLTLSDGSVVPLDQITVDPIA